MSRKTMTKGKSRPRKRSDSTPSAANAQGTSASKSPRRPLYHLLSQLLGWPRLARITFVAISSLLMALFLTPLLTDVHWRFAYTLDTYYAPAVLTILFACVMYIVGWRLIVGTPGEPPQPRPALLGYFVVMLFVLLAALAWIVVTAIPAFMEA